MGTIRQRVWASIATIALVTAGAAFAFAPAAGAVATTNDTTITLKTSNANATYGTTGKLTAIVKPAMRSAIVPTGSVDFMVDGSWYWTSTLDATGKATLAFSDLFGSLTPGTYAITASYSGDANYNPSTTAAPLMQSVTGPTTAPVTTLTLNTKNKPVFSVRSFKLFLNSPAMCNVTIQNDTPNTQALVYGFPGTWKRLPFGTIAPGAALGVGVSLAGYTGYFATMANTSNYIAIHCK